jgi:hypothetical protein
MKRIYSRVSIVIYTLCLFSACHNDLIGKYPLKVLENKKVFIDEFRNISVLRRGKNAIILYLYNGPNKRQVFFDVSDEGKFALTETSKKVNENLFEKDKLLEKQLITLVQKKVKLMNKYDIREVSHEFQNQGISMEVYFNSLESLLYIRDITKVKNIEWLRHLKKIKKLDEHWFYEAEQS